MPWLIRSLLVVVLSILSFGLGYRVAHRGDGQLEIARQAPSEVHVPAGLTGDLATALDQPDLLDRAGAVARLLDPLGADALDEVQAAYDRALLDTGDVELVLLLDWWARFDPEGALRRARDSKLGWHPAVLTAVFRAWARQDPEAASEALRSVRDDRLLGAARVGLVRGWDESGQDGLEEYLAGLESGAESVGPAIEAFVRGKIARGTPEIAMEWAEALPNKDSSGIASLFKLDVVGRVAALMVASDPDRAAEWAERTRGDANAPLLLIRVAAAWAQRDGPAAMRWLGGLPPGLDVPTAVQETFRSWYLQDPKAAEAWIRSVELEPWLDPAVATFAQQQALEHPEDALEWARRVVDSERRDQVFVKLGATWLLNRPEEGPGLIERARFSEEVRRRIDVTHRAYESRRGLGGPRRVPEPPVEPEPAAAGSE